MVLIWCFNGRDVASYKYDFDMEMNWVNTTCKNFGVSSRFEGRKDERPRVLAIVTNLW